MSATSTKCSKCQREAEDEATLCKNCAASTDAKDEKKQREKEEEKEEAKTEKDCVKMEIDTDLTTTETLDDLDELDELTKQKEEKEKEMARQNQQKQSEAKQQQQQLMTKVKEEAEQQQQPEEQSLLIKAELAADGDADSKMAAVPSQTCQAPNAPASQATQRGGKITRSSLNGSRSPNIMKRLRKSTRSTRFKAKLTGRGGAAGGGGAGGAGAGGGATNGHNGATNCKTHGKLGGGAAGGGGGGSAASTPRNRRTLFKRPAQKTPRVQATTRFVKSVFYKGSYMQIGDIVSIVDSEHNVYYAQIRGLLVDAYCEKSAFLTWLIPTQDSPDPRDGFDPATYLIGPDEELSRKLCYLEFIMHAPSNYYFDRTTPFPLPDVDEYAAQRTGGFIWTRLPIFKRERERERERERDRVGKAAA
ncbi:keratin, type I cytoskeletal 10 isoform X2 [Drosophila innubila]|uniref:keratin, type I cytoskeletal 10 isoform X2 n=1 Tax=Drosophila innubila TaxID=198719 RepID=UPI00148C9FB4|nr:keratin, type I cytoskeletal 10 isoform X2 [Drosophila innubila]